MLTSGNIGPKFMQQRCLILGHRYCASCCDTLCRHEVAHETTLEYCCRLLFIFFPVLYFTLPILTSSDFYAQLLGPSYVNRMALKYAFIKTNNK